MSGKPPNDGLDAGDSRKDAGGDPMVPREKLPTLTNSKELEAARKKSLESLPSTPPDVGASTRPTPRGLSPAQAPLGKAPPPLTLDEFTDLDRGWGEEFGGGSDDDAGSPATARVQVPEVGGAKSHEPDKKPAARPPPLPSTRRSSKVRAAENLPPTRPADKLSPLDLDLNDALGSSDPAKAEDEKAKTHSSAPTAPPPPNTTTAAETAPPKADEIEAEPASMKTYPSARSLVAEVDADAMVSALMDGLDDEPRKDAKAPPGRASPPPPLAVTTPAKPPPPVVAMKPPTPPPLALKPPTPPPTPVVPKPAAKAPDPPASKPAESAPATKKGAEAARDMRDRFALGDYSGALDVAETILAGDPNDQEAIDMAQNCRAALEQMYTARIGPMDRVPIVMVPSGELRWLSIDHRAGFVLSNIDGVSSLEMIIDVSGMTTLDALRILCELAQQRIISFR